MHDAIPSTWFAELMRHLIEKLEDKAFQAIFKPGVLDGALAEAAELEPHLKVLDQGKKTKAYNATFKSHGQALASNKTETRDAMLANAGPLTSFPSGSRLLLKLRLAEDGSCTMDILRKLLAALAVGNRTMMGYDATIDQEAT